MSQAGEAASKLLLVIRHSPYASLAAREALDAALTAAAFEVPVSLLFLNDGSYALLSNQHPEPLQLKSLAKTLPALALYDIDQVYTASRDLQLRGIDASQLALEVHVLDDNDVAALFHQHQHILSF